MHATIEQLLAIRDREPLAIAIRQHAELCLLCRERLDELVLIQAELKRLPEQAPPQDHWPDIQAQSEHRMRASRQRQKLLRYSGYGLAASALLASILIVYQSEYFPEPAVTPQVVMENEPAKAAQISVMTPGQTDTDPQAVPDAGDTDLNELIARSARLEAVLHAMPRRPRVTRASTADLITGLQDGVALVDYQLNFSARDLPAQTSRQLWQQRVDLMNSLVTVRYAEAQQVAYTPN